MKKRIRKAVKQFSNTSQLYNHYDSEEVVYNG